MTNKAPSMIALMAWTPVRDSCVMLAAPQANTRSSLSSAIDVVCCSSIDLPFGVAGARSPARIDVQGSRAGLRVLSTRVAAG